MPRVIIMEKPRRMGKSLDARRAMMAKIHIAKKELALDEDSYRAVLKRITGKDSSADLSLAQLELVLTEFTRLGFAGKPRTVREGSKGGLPSDDQARKIRALWLNLYHLGELESGSEEALLAYCKRMSGVARIEWMHAEQFDNVIRGLRGWLQRVGWVNPHAEDITSIAIARSKLMIDANPASVNYSGIAAKVATVKAQYKLLGKDMEGLVPELVEAELLDQLISAMGQACRLHKQATKGA